MSKLPNGFGMSKAPKKWGTLMLWKNSKQFKGGRKSIRKMDLGGFGNGSSKTAFFNGKHDKHLNKQKGFMAPVYTPDKIEGMTDRYKHKPWPFKKAV